MSVPRHWILGGWYPQRLMSTSRAIDGVIVITNLEITFLVPEVCKKDINLKWNLDEIKSLKMWYLDWQGHSNVDINISAHDAFLE